MNEIRERKRSYHPKGSSREDCSRLGVRVSGEQDYLEHHNWGELRKAGGDRESECVQKT